MSYIKLDLIAFHQIPMFGAKMSQKNRFVRWYLCLCLSVCLSDFVLVLVILLVVYEHDNFQNNYVIAFRFPISGH